MTKNVQIFVGCAVLVLVGLGLAYLHTSGAPMSASLSTPIKIGFVGPLSGDGAAWGEIERNTIEMTVDEVNAAGGINGRPIDVTYEDGKCEGATALSAAKKLVEIDHIKILLVSCSQEMQSIMPYTEQQHAIAWTSYASASNITNGGDYVFRNSYSNIDMARSMADLALKKGKRVAVISETSAFATDLEHFLVTDVAAGGGTIVAQEDFEPGSRDVRTQVTKVLAMKPDVVVLNPNGRDTGIVILDQLKTQKYAGPLVGNFFGGSKAVQQHPEAQGMVYVSDPLLVNGSLKQTVFDAYKARFGTYPDIEWPVGSRYDAVYILKNALLAVGDDPAKVKDYLHHMPEDFTGMVGTYKFNANNADITNVHPAIAKIQNFTSVPVQ